MAARCNANADGVREHSVTRFILFCTRDHEVRFRDPR